MRNGDDPEQRSRKARDAALILPIMGVLLLTPPIAQIFAIDQTIGGVPAVVLYVIGIWAALIALARRLSRLLGADDANEPPEG